MADLAAAVAVPFIVEAVKGLCNLIIEKHNKKKESTNQVVDAIDTEKLKSELKKDLKQLSFKVGLFQGIMLGAVDKPDQDPPVQIWLDELKQVLYDAEDLLDGYATDIAVQEMEERCVEERIDDVAAAAVPTEGCVEERVDAAAAVPTERVKRGLRAKVRVKLSSFFARTKNISHRDSDDHVDNISESATKLSNFSIKIKDIISELDELQKTRAGLGLIIKPNENAINKKRRETTSTPEQYIPVVGREDDKRSVKYAIDSYLVERKDGPSSSTIQEKPIVSRSLFIGTDSARENILKSLQSNDKKNDNRQPMLSILPIVGIGGLGKTTLARMIYNDSEIKENSDLKVWICVSDNFDNEIILKKIIDSINPSNVITSLQALEQELMKLVQGKHLFLVLDDIWCDDKGLWESFLNPFKAACNNSRGIDILITTRLANIAKVIPGCMEPFVLKGLEEEDMWKLLMFHAFHNCNTVDDNTHHILETIGKDIVPRLKGSPLAAKTIGRLLASKHTTEHWKKILESDLHTLEQGEDDIIPILRLSYQHLPGYLKQCLLYFSLLPKDEEFPKSIIVHTWMANNCIRGIGNRNVVDVGNEYFDLLVERSFVELLDGVIDDEVYIYGNAKCSMHDLIHDLIQSVSKYDCYWQYTNKYECGINIPPSVRHASISSSVSHFPNYKKLRTLMIVNDCIDLAELMKIRSMSCLRFLWVVGECPEELLECICNLKHLRVLYFTQSGRITFPGSIYGRLREPQNVTRLVNLRYLMCNPETLSHVHGIGKLSLLQDLPLFCVKNQEGFHISQLKDMSMLHGKLEIRNLHLVKSKEEAEQAFLNKKVHLRKLKINWFEYGDSDIDLEDEREKEIAEEVLDGLKPCSHLKRLSILNYVGGRLPSWMTASWLSSLESITLEKCPKVKSLPIGIGKFRFLKKLHVKIMPSLKYMKWQGDEGSLFPALEEVYLYNLPKWVGWWIETEDEEEGPQLEYRNHRRETSVLPRLKNMTLRSCPEATCFAARAPVLESLELNNVVSSTHEELLGDHSLPHLRDLIIEGIRDLTSLHLLTTVPALENLRIKDCPNLTTCLLPPAMALKELDIYNCHRISCLKWQPQHSHFPDEDSMFPLLEKLFLSNLPEWVGWWVDVENEEEEIEYQKRTRTLPGLKKLKIYNCPKATCFAVRAPALEELHLESVPASLLVDVQVVSSLEETPSVNTHHRQSQMGTSCNILPHLTYLWISEIPDLTSLNITTTIPSLENLQIYSCANLTSCLLPTIPSMGILQIRNCPKLSSCLLRINHCEPISCLREKTKGQAEPHGDILFPALEMLILENLPEWVGWSAEAEGNVFCALPRLTELDVRHCPKATCSASLLQVVSSLETPSVNTHHHQSQMHLLPNLISLHLLAATNLKHLIIISCPNLISCLLPPAPVALETLRISKCDRISSILLCSPVLSIDYLFVGSCPELVSIGSIANHQEPSPVEISSHVLLSIKSLEIEDCPKLGMTPRTQEPSPVAPKGSEISSQLPSSHVLSVESLIIRDCHSKQLLRLLRGLDGVNLKQLDIGNCNDMERYDDDYDGEHGGLSTTLLQLTSLVYLSIKNLPRLRSLPPNIFEKLVYLERITLARCPLLSSFPDLGLLTSLRNLEITYCPKLKDLPGVIHLTSLKKLIIICCPELTEKYRKRLDGKGNNVNPHWNNISHIYQRHFS